MPDALLAILNPIASAGWSRKSASRPAETGTAADLIASKFSSRHWASIPTVTPVAVTAMAIATILRAAICCQAVITRHACLILHPGVNRCLAAMIDQAATIDQVAMTV